MFESLHLTHHEISPVMDNRSDVMHPFPDQSLTDDFDDSDSFSSDSTLSLENTSEPCGNAIVPKNHPVLFRIVMIFLWIFFAIASALPVCASIGFTLQVGCILNRLNVYGGLLGILLCVIPFIGPNLRIISVMSGYFHIIRSKLQVYLIPGISPREVGKWNVVFRYHRYIEQNGILAHPCLSVFTFIFFLYILISSLFIHL